MWTVHPLLHQLVILGLRAQGSLWGASLSSHLAGWEDIGAFPCRALVSCLTNLPKMLWGRLVRAQSSHAILPVPSTAQMRGLPGTPDRKMISWPQAGHRTLGCGYVFLLGVWWGTFGELRQGHLSTGTS